MWYFTGGGMILWFVDRLVRFRRSAATFHVVSVNDHNDGDTTEIVLQPSSSFSFRAGQYAFINIPTLTPLEWHPFSISSAPEGSTLTFHIKNMGKDTWTSRLSRIYCSPDYQVDPLPIVNVDGPYGRPPSFEDYETVILVAGGIGVTPLISIFKDQYQLHKEGHPGSQHIKNIYLIWVVRDISYLEMFRYVFDDIAHDHNSQDKFHIKFCVTRRSFSKSLVEHSPLEPQPTMGRPNIHQEFADIAKSGNKNVMTLVCGPQLMINEVQNAAFFFKFDLHTETFEL